ncbi:MAG: MazG nucleotide pyrophosphohydrolase domain-containing protein [Actinomycetales bacterium]
MLTLVAVPVGVAPALLTREAWRAIEAAASVYADPALLAGLPADLEARPLPVADPRLPNDAAALPAVWLVPAGSLPAAQAAVGDGRGEVTVVSAPDLPAPDVLGAELLELVAVMDRLRSPGGCPWDAEQTHASLRGYLLEEAHEAYDAIVDDDPAGMREELGDVLLQVAFHARVAAEEGPERRFDIDDVATDLVDKLVRRHPHVFGDAGPRNVSQVEEGWEEIKRAEKQRRSPTEGVSRSQPAASWGAALVRRAARAGLSTPQPAELAASSPEELGERLLAVVAAAEARGWDAEDALREAVRRYAGELDAEADATRG